MLVLDELLQVLGTLIGSDPCTGGTVQRDERLARIVEAIETRELPPMTLSTLARKTIAVFQAIAFCRRKYGLQAIGSFIVSMTEGADDIMSVILLAQWGELHNRGGDVPLDVAPLLETVETEGRALSCEVAIIFLDKRIAPEAVQFFESQGYKRGELEEFYPAWRESAKEFLTDDNFMMVKMLRERRVMRPL